MSFNVFILQMWMVTVASTVTHAMEERTMTTMLHNTATVPSSVLSNGQDVRAQYTRVAARQASAKLSRLASQLRGRQAWNQAATSRG